MSRFQPPPFRSLRDLVLKELQDDNSTLVWNRDRTFADDFLSRLLDGEAYIVDRSAQEYLAELSEDIEKDDYFRAITNIRLPFKRVWIESVFDDFDEDDGSRYDVTYGALVEEAEDGVDVMHAMVVHSETPWRPVYSGTDVLFAVMGRLSAQKRRSRNSMTAWLRHPAMI